MSKWRPTSTGNIYVISDIHGKADELQLILDRILPLRDGKDIIIQTGDLVDRGPKIPEVIDIFINLKEKYKDQVITLRGNHEQMLLSSAGRIGACFDPLLASTYSMFINNGGEQTISQYAARKGIEIKNPKILNIDRAISFLDEKHLDFLEKTLLYYELDNYIFVHAGCDPNIPIKDQNEDILLWDRSLYATVKKIVNLGNNLPWDKTIVTGHNYDGPYINQKFMMLDASAKDKLLVVEMNSMECFMAGTGKNRLVKLFLEEAKPNKSIIKRVT